MKTEIPEIGKEYIEYVNEETKKINPDILLYGSTVYGKISSELDISFIVKKYDKEEYEKIKNLTMEFQRKHGMNLDEEVPYSSKLVYTDADVEDMLKNSPFKKVNGIYRITPIEKTPEFLGSKEMKYRLLLNILTTRSLLLQGDTQKIDTYKQKAWDLLVKIIISYNELSEIDLDHFIQLLYKDEKTNQDEEMFLGYKTNIKQKQIDLEDDCERTFDRLVKEGKLKKEAPRQFKASDEWER